MPSQLSRGQTFTDGGTGSASQFHALVDQGRILPGAISEQTAAQIAVGDYLMFLQSQSNALRKCSVTQLINAFPRGGDNSQFALRKLGTQAGMAARGDDPRFPAKFTGIRKANNNSPDTAATPFDLTPLPVNLQQGTTIDWHAGDVFYASLTGNKTYIFANASSGRVITVAIKHNGHTVAWPPLVGAAPQITGSATIHYFTFIMTPLGVSGTVVAL